MPETKKQWNQRQRVWRHNGFMGQVKRAEIAGLSVAAANSVTKRGQQIGRDIATLARLLQIELKTRIDP
jgi:hypothetical protein